jgi:ribosome biogenesis protein Nip4
MELFKTFVTTFTDTFNFDDVMKINKKYYLIDEKVRKLIENLDIEEVRSAGLYLGEEKSKKFNASINLLSMLKDKTEKYIKLNEKTSWLFICGRDIFDENIIEKGKAFSNVLVLNNKNEVIGIAKRDKKDKNIFLNFYDIGHLLRREKGKK